MLQDNLSPLAIDLTIPLERQIQEAVLVEGGRRMGKKPRSSQSIQN